MDKKSKFFQVTRMTNGEIRVLADLFSEEVTRRLVREEMSKVLDEARAKAEVPEYMNAETMSNALVAIIEAVSEKAATEQINRRKDSTDHNQS